MESQAEGLKRWRGCFGERHGVNQRANQSVPALRLNVDNSLVGWGGVVDYPTVGARILFILLFLIMEVLGTGAFCCFGVLSVAHLHANSTSKALVNVKMV